MNNFTFLLVILLLCGGCGRRKPDDSSAADRVRPYVQRPTETPQRRSNAQPRSNAKPSTSPSFSTEPPDSSGIKPILKQVEALKGQPLRWLAFHQYDGECLSTDQLAYTPEGALVIWLQYSGCLVEFTIQEQYLEDGNLLLASSANEYDGRLADKKMHYYQRGNPYQHWLATYTYPDTIYYQQPPSDTLVQWAKATIGQGGWPNPPSDWMDLTQMPNHWHGWLMDTLDEKIRFSDTTQYPGFDDIGAYWLVDSAWLASVGLN